MSAVVLTFKPGDPVPPWFIDVEPRADVAANLPALVEPLEFNAVGEIIDAGDRYEIKLAPGYPLRRAIVGNTRYCDLVNDKTILWPDGERWKGVGPVEPVTWTPDPERVKRAAKTMSEIDRIDVAIENARVISETLSRYNAAPAYHGLAIALGLAFGAVIGVVAGIVMVTG